MQRIIRAQDSADGRACPFGRSRQSSAWRQLTRNDADRLIRTAGGSEAFSAQIPVALDQLPKNIDTLHFANLSSQHLDDILLPRYLRPHPGAAMWEILKVIWDIFVLRDAARRGKLNWRKTGFVVGFVVLEYLIAMPALILYIQHPQYRTLFIAAMVLAVVVLVVFVGLAWRLRSRSSAA